MHAWNDDDTPWNRWEMLNTYFESSIVHFCLLHRYLCSCTIFLRVSVTVTSEKQILWTNVVSWRKHWIPLEVLLTWSKNDSNELFLCENNGSWTVVDRLNECKRCYFCHEMTMMAEMAMHIKYNVVVLILIFHSCIITFNLISQVCPTNKAIMVTIMKWWYCSFCPSNALLPMS